MAVTAFGQLSVMQKIVWARAITNAGRDMNFFMSNGFVGQNTEDMSKPVHRITELTPTEGGTAAVIPLVTDLQEDGQVGDDMVDGNEEEMIDDAQVIQIDQLRHGVRSKGKYAEQETVLRFRNIARNKLSFWLSDIIDELMFLTLMGIAYTFRTDGTTRASSRLPSLKFAGDVTAPTSNRTVYAGDVSDTASLVAANKMSWRLLIHTRTITARRRIKPIMDGGKGHYVVVMSEEQARDLQLDPTYQAIVARAGPRTSQNPLFRNAMAVVGGLVLHCHQKAFNTLEAASGSKWGAGSAIDGANFACMGAQAIGMATLGTPSFAEDPKDYGNRAGIAYGRMFGLKKPVYKSVHDAMTSQDFGVLTGYTAAASAPSSI